MDSTGNVSRRTLLSALVGSTALSLLGTAYGEAWPSRPVKIVTGYGVGSGGDLAVRLVAEQLGKQLGQPFVVEAKPGAGNLLAARLVKESAADGHTLFAGNPTVFGPVFLKNPLDAAKELTPVTLFSSADAFLYTSPAFASVKALAEAGKAEPIRFGSINPSATMMAAMLAQTLGIKYEIIPFRTAEQVIQALVANEVQGAFRSAGTYSELVASGRMNVLLTLSPKRSSFAPTVPTATELGVPVVLMLTNGFWAPLGTPPAIIASLNAEVKRALAVPKVVEGFRGAFQFPQHTTPEAQVDSLRHENEFYAKGAAMTGYVRN